MNRGGKLLLLVAALAVVLGAYFGVSAAVKKNEEQQSIEAAQTNAESLAVGEYDAIDAMDWTYGGVRVRLERDADGQWVCPDEPDCPIDQSKAAVMQSAAAYVSGQLYVEAAESLDDYGVSEPELSLTVRAGDAERSYTVGAYSELAGAYYMTVDGGTDVYLESGDLTDSFWYDLENLVQFESVPSDVGTLTSLAVESQAASYTLERVDEPLTVNYTDAFDWFRAADGAYTALATADVEALCSKAMQISFKTCASWNAEEAEYGLDAPQATVTVGYTTTDGADAAFTLQFGSYCDGGEVYVRIAGSKLVYRADGSVLDALMYADLASLAPENFLALDGAEIASLTLETDGLGRAVDTELVDVQDFLADLSALYSTGAAPEGASRELLLTVTAEFESAAVPSLTIAFYRYDSASCVCVANGVGHLVPRTGAEALAESAGALLRAR